MTKKLIIFALLIPFFIGAEDTYILNYDDVDIKKVTQDVASFSNKTISPRIRHQTGRPSGTNTLNARTTLNDVNYFFHISILPSKTLVTLPDRKILVKIFSDLLRSTVNSPPLVFKLIQSVGKVEKDEMWKEIRRIKKSNEEDRLQKQKKVK